MNELLTADYEAGVGMMGECRNNPNSNENKMEKEMMDEHDEDQNMNKSNFISNNMDKTSNDKPEKQHQKPSRNEKNGAVKLKQTKNLNDQLNSKTPSQLFSSTSNQPNKQQGTMLKGNFTVKQDGSMRSQDLQANTDSSEGISIKFSETTKKWPNPKDYGCEQGARNEDTDTVPADQSLRQGPTVLSEEKKNRIIVNKSIMHPEKEKKTEEDHNVLRWVFGFLNLKENQRGTLLLRKKEGKVKTIMTKDFDTWCQGIESRIKESLSYKHIIDFINIKMKDWNSKEHEIELSVKPAPNLSTLNYYLYYPCTSSVDQVEYSKAVELLSQEGPPGPLPTIPNRTYKLDHEVEGLRNENEYTQFKEIKGGNVLHKSKKMCSHSISAFGNYKGGDIYYGINDKTGKVVGVNLLDIKWKEKENAEESKLESAEESKIESAEESKVESEEESVEELVERAKELVESAFEERIGGMFYGKPSQKLIRGTHWDIQIFDIEGGEKSMKIIAVSVCKIPGGVFTAVPESYYVDDDEVLKNYKFEDWKSKLLKSDKDIKPSGTIYADEIPSYSGSCTPSQTSGGSPDKYYAIHPDQRHRHKDLPVNTSEGGFNLEVNLAATSAPTRGFSIGGGTQLASTSTGFTLGGIPAATSATAVPTLTGLLSGNPPGSTGALGLGGVAPKTAASGVSFAQTTLLGATTSAPATRLSFGVTTQPATDLTLGGLAKTTTGPTLGGIAQAKPGFSLGGTISQPATGLGGTPQTSTGFGLGGTTPLQTGLTIGAAGINIGQATSDGSSIFGAKPQVTGLGGVDPKTSAVTSGNPNVTSLPKCSLTDPLILKEKRNTTAKNVYELQDSVRQLSDEERHELIKKLIEKDQQFVYDNLGGSTNEQERINVRQTCPELVTSIWSALMRFCCCRQRAEPH
ncbi:uncharacterized protein LOC127726711 isoform X3 [Mytilus californianus]|uniref:uncharacterized protein LOC127726711 isoform X3 n=1 Tax=Mytilus californianus TaxID=6549 RepID=UPI0022454D70|nr:uncharacterized protein LOC127726711 isoform X3 [Mytilus californianus]